MKNEIGNFSVESIRTPKSTERDLAVDSIERLNSKLKEFASTMSIDTEALTNEPEGGEPWDKIEHYLKCLRISEEQPESIFLPYWGSVRLPTPNKLAEPDTEEYTPKDVLGRLFVVNAALDVEFDYYNQDTSKEEVMTLGQLISDVYPGLQGGVKEIREELEFAFRKPEEFRKKFSERKKSAGGLTRGAFIKKGMEVTAASLFVLTSMTLASCSGKQVQTEATPIVETDSQVVPTETEEPTLTPTETQEPTPTPTKEAIEETEVPEEPSIEKLKEKYGYVPFLDSRENPETGFDEFVLAIYLEGFRYSDYIETEEGNFLLGTIEFKGGDYPLKVLVDPESSKYYFGNSGRDLDSETAGRLRTNEDYDLALHIRRKDGTYLLRHELEEETELLENIEEMLLNGGYSSKYFLGVGYIVSLRY